MRNQNHRTDNGWYCQAKTIERVVCNVVYKCINRVIFHLHRPMYSYKPSYAQVKRQTLHIAPNERRNVGYEPKHRAYQSQSQSQWAEPTEVRKESQCAWLHTKNINYPGIFRSNYREPYWYPNQLSSWLYIGLSIPITLCTFNNNKY